jgi:formylglycine-generating enzyme required for sulfatase activity
MGKVSDCGRRVALVVGVDHYEDDHFNELHCAVTDAARVCGFLEQAARYDRVQLLASHVTADAVIQAVKVLTKPLGSGDLFVFYFAGHGAEHEGRHILLCPQAEYLGLRYHHGCVPVDYVRELTDERGMDRIFILDACRTDLLRARGQGTTGLRGEAGLRDVVARAQVGKGSFAMLCSCSEGEQARELPGRGHGLFTAALLTVLRAGVNSGTEVAVSDGLRLNLVQVMGSLSEECGWPERQYPWYKTGGSGTPILIPGTIKTNGVGPSRRPVEVMGPSHFHVETVPAGAQVSVDGLVVGTAPVSLALPNGRYRIRAQKVGYKPWERQVRFDGADDAELRIELEKQPRIVDAFFPMTAEEAKEVQRAAAEALGAPLTTELDSGKGVKLPLVLIPSGKFLMGSPQNEEGRDSEEGPQHEVTISRPFYMGRFPVTQAQYEAVMGENSSHFRGDANPVENIDWDAASKFCVRLTGKVGRTVCLPTEAQWEYACRAGNAARFGSGDNDGALELYAWYGKNSDRQTHPAGQKKPNAWGLYDMHGNVWEWCADWYGQYGKEAAVDPKGPYCVVRGGSWYCYPWICRSACRRWRSPDSRIRDLGFRVVYSIEA